MLDRDLAQLYGVETRVLKQAVIRNHLRFPDDFMFELTKDEADSLRSQNVILKRGQHYKYLPFAFTEQVVAVLSSVLKIDRAIVVNIHIMRAFAQLRHIALQIMQLSNKNDISSQVGLPLLSEPQFLAATDRYYSNSFSES